jgi:uncharacterized protein YggE
MKKWTLLGTFAGATLVVMLVAAFAGVGASGVYAGPPGNPSGNPAGASGLGASGVYTTVVPSKSPTPKSETTAGTITVVGVGKVMVVPDVVKVQLGVETISNTVAAATAENDKVMKAVLAALKKEGVADKDVQTAYYSIYPEYEQSQPGKEAQSPKIIGYRVSNSVTVTIRDTKDMKKVSAVLEAVVTAGVNSVGGITFSLENPQAVEDQGRKLAVADAKRRAEDLATLTGVTLGPVIQVSEVISGPPVVTRQNVAPAALGGGASIVPGEQEYIISIQITYAIR